MPARLEHVIQVRSQLVEAMLAYLRRMEAELAKNPLLDRFDRPLDDLRVPLCVVPYEPAHALEDIRAREHFRHMGASGDRDDADRAARRVWAFLGSRFDQDQASRPTPERLDEVEPKLETAALVGDPGSGKTEWLKQRARRAMQEARERLEAMRAGIDQIGFPAYLRLRDVAAELEQDAQREQHSPVREFLVETGCLRSRTTPLSDAERAAGAMLKALVEHYHLPARLAQWVWGQWLPPGIPAARPQQYSGMLQSGASPAGVSLFNGSPASSRSHNLRQAATCPASAGPGRMSTCGASVMDRYPSRMADVSRLPRLDEAVEVLTVDEHPPQRGDLNRLQDPPRDEPTDAPRCGVEIGGRRLQPQ